MSSELVSDDVSVLQIDAPIRTEWVEVPTTCLTFLGIVLNSDTMEASIPIKCKTLLYHSSCTLKNAQKCIAISYWQIILHMQNASSKQHFSYAGLLT